MSAPSEVPAAQRLATYGSVDITSTGISADGPCGMQRRPSLKPFAQGNSVLLTAGVIIADVVGAGILSMGTAVAKLGWLPGALAIIVMLAMNVHISLLLWRVRMSCPDSFTYLGVASAAFSQAPEWQRQVIKAMTGTSQFVFLFCCMGLYSLAMGKSIGSVFYHEWRLCTPQLTFLGLLLILPFAVSSRSMGKWDSLVYMNVLTIMGSVVIPLVHMAVSGVNATRPPGSVMVAVADLSFGKTIVALEVMLFSFTSQFMLVEIISEMRDIRELPKAYMVSVPFQGLMFLISGIGEYYFMGDGVHGMILNSIPFGISWRIAACCLLVHMVISYLIKGVVFTRAVHWAVDPSKVNHHDARGWSVWSTCVVVVMACAWLLAQVVPFFTELVDILGATLTPVSCWIVPILLFWRWEKDFAKKEETSGLAESVLIGVELVLAMVIMTFGTYFAISDLVEKWASHGLPFECHCQNIWDTCGCSADNPAMTGQCGPPAGNVP